MAVKLAATSMKPAGAGIQESTPADFVLLDAVSTARLE